MPQWGAPKSAEMAAIMNAGAAQALSAQLSNMAPALEDAAMAETPPAVSLSKKGKAGKKEEKKEDKEDKDDDDDEEEEGACTTKPFGQCSGMNFTAPKDEKNTFNYTTGSSAPFACCPAGTSCVQFGPVWGMCMPGWVAAKPPTLALR